MRRGPAAGGGNLANEATQALPIVPPLSSSQWSTEPQDPSAPALPPWLDEALPDAETEMIAIISPEPPGATTADIAEQSTTRIPSVPIRSIPETDISHLPTRRLTSRP